MDKRGAPSKLMSGKKLDVKRRHSIFDSIYNGVDIKPEEFCRRRELAHPVHLTEKQKQILAAWMAKRDLFL